METVGSPRVFGLFSSERLFLKVLVFLEERDVRLVRFPVSERTPLPEGSGPILTGPEVAENASASTLVQFSRSDLGPWITVADRGGSVLSIQDGILVLPDDARVLLSTIRWGWVVSIARRFNTRVHEFGDCRSCLRAALSRIVRAASLGGIVAAKEILPSVRERSGLLEGLAEDIGISTSHLCRLAKRQPVGLTDVHDAWRMILAVILRMEEGSWERAAWRLGFEGGPGLTALAHRTLGTGPRNLERKPGFGLENAERHLMRLIGAPKAGKARAERKEQSA